MAFSCIYTWRNLKTNIMNFKNKLVITALVAVATTAVVITACRKSKDGSPPPLVQ